MAVACLKIDRRNADALYVRALYVCNENLSRGVHCLGQIHCLYPDHDKANNMLLAFKKQAAHEVLVDKYIEEKKYDDAKQKLTKSIESFSKDVPQWPANAKIPNELFYLLADINAKIGLLRSAINDCKK